MLGMDVFRSREMVGSRRSRSPSRRLSALVYNVWDSTVTMMGQVGASSSCGVHVLWIMLSRDATTLPPVGSDGESLMSQNWNRSSDRLRAIAMDRRVSLEYLAEQ